MTPDEVDRIEKYFKTIQDALMENTKAISRMEVLVHTPANCALGDKVRDLELQNAKNKGIFVTIGFFVTAVSATISGLIVKFLK